MNRFVRRSAVAVGATLAIATAASAPALADPPPPPDINSAILQALRCGFIGAFGTWNQLIDPSCRFAPATLSTP